MAAEPDICIECGDRKLLNKNGVCKNRHGCQHRQYQHRVRMQRLEAEMAYQEHVRKNVSFFQHYSSRPRPSDWQNSWGGSYGPLGDNAHFYDWYTEEDDD